MRLPTANQLHQSFVKILSKHLAANKKVSFAFQRKSSIMPMMSPTEIVELFTFVEVTLVQYATVAGHLPEVAAAAVKAKPTRASQAEVVVKNSQSKKHKRALLHQDPKAKDPTGAPLLLVLLRPIESHQSQSRLAREVEKGKGANLSKGQRSEDNSISPSIEERARGEITATMSIKLIAKGNSRSMMRLSKGSTTTRPKQRQSQHQREELGSQLR